MVMLTVVAIVTISSAVMIATPRWRFSLDGGELLGPDNLARDKNILAIF
jgi:hypothetical protein